MIATAGIIARVAGGEAITAPPLATSVVLTPRVGDEVTLEVTDGQVEITGVDVPNIVTAEWVGAGVTTTIEVVEYHYFPLQRLRDYGDGADDFDVLEDSMLEMARQNATEIIEQNSERSFVERLGFTFDWGGDEFIYLDDNDIREIVTEGYLQVSYNQCFRTQPVTGQIWYKFGHELPQAVADACLELAAFLLRPSNRPTGATGESSDAGYIHFTLAGRDGATDIPEVNAIIQQFGAGKRLAW